MKNYKKQQETPHCPYVPYFKACGGEDCVCCEIFVEMQHDQSNERNEYGGDE